MVRWTASAKWGEAPALDGRRDMPLALRLSEGLGVDAQDRLLWCAMRRPNNAEDFPGVIVCFEHLPHLVTIVVNFSIFEKVEVKCHPSDVSILSDLDIEKPFFERYFCSGYEV